MNIVFSILEKNKEYIFINPTEFNEFATCWEIVKNAGA